MRAVVDISSAVTLSRLLRAYRFIVGVAILVCVFGYLTFLDTVWLWSLPGLFAGYAIFRFPRRPVLLALLGFMFLSLMALAVWCLFWPARALYETPDTETVLPFVCILCASYFFWRGLRKLIPGKPPRTPNSAMFSVQPTLLDNWQARGLIPFLTCGLILLMGLALASVRQIGLLLLAVVAGFAAVFLFIPAIKALGDPDALPLICATTLPQLGKLRQSYLLFVVSNIMRTPKALGWLANGVLGIVFAGAISAFFQYLGMSSSPWMGSIVMGNLVLSWRKASQHALMRAVKTSDPDSEPFTLFLRSFLDEELQVRGTSSLMIFWSMMFVSPQTMKSTRLEELVARVVWPFGKLIALGRPGEELPEIGALRLKVSTAELWQTSITHLIAKARHVLIATGISTGLIWEFKRFGNPQDRTKLSLIIPPEDSPYASWKIFAKDDPELLAYSEDELERALTMRFDQDGSPILLTTKHKSAEAYRIAISSCFLGLDQFAQLTGKTLERTHR